MPEITSTHNPKIKSLRALRLRKYREREGRYLIEGIRIVEEALTMGAPVEMLIYAPGLLVSERAQALVERAAAIERLAVSPAVFESLSLREGPQGIAALVRIEDRPLGSIPPRDDLLVIVAYQLQDPGNLGSIIRTADAAGASGVVVVEPSVDLYDPQTVRATMGSLYALPIVRLEEGEALFRWCDALRGALGALRVVATSAHGPALFYEEDYRGPVVLLVGNEQEGLPLDVRQRADALVRLPMFGRATSLNVSAATAAMVYEIVRQRLVARSEAAAQGHSGRRAMFEESER